MTIYINGQCLERMLTGVERYTLSVLKAMDRLLVEEAAYADVDAVLLLPPAGHCDVQLKRIGIQKIGRGKGHFWEQIELPFYCRGKFLLSLHSVAPLMQQRQLLVMHDAKVVHREKSDASELARRWYVFLGRVLGRRLPRIIAISNYAAQDIHEGYGIPYEKIKVILNGRYDLSNVSEDVDILRRHDLHPHKFILAVGGGSTKNNILTAYAVEQLRDNEMVFVVAGHSPESVRAKLNSCSKTRCIGRVTDEELAALYKNALCLAFPSFVEGFGAPPLEAMSVGCPVIASTCEAVPEICGDAALYVDCHSVDSMREKIEQVIYNSELRMHQIERGYENLRRFDWTRTAKAILDEAISVMKLYY